MSFFACLSDKSIYFSVSPCIATGEWEVHKKYSYETTDVVSEEIELG